MFGLYPPNLFGSILMAKGLVQICVSQMETFHQLWWSLDQAQCEWVLQSSGRRGGSFARSKWSREMRIAQLPSPWNEHMVVSGKGNLFFPLLNVYLGQGGKIRFSCQSLTGVVKI